MENQEFKKQLIARAFNLAKSSFKLVDKFPSKRSTQVIANQLLRAISSIGANKFKVQNAKFKVRKRSKNFKFLTQLLTFHFEFLTEAMS